MSGTLKNNHKRTATQTGSSMHFWGICCESGKQYAQVVGQRFRITMAVLDPSSVKKDPGNKIVSLLVNRNDIEYLLCVLKHGEIPQMSLNLIFDKGEKVKFYIHGQGKVYLSGYQLTDSEGDVINDESGYLCPLIEVPAKNKKAESSRVSPREQKKATSKKMKTEESLSDSDWTSFLYQNEDESEDDEDFSLGDETESEEESSMSSEEDVEEEGDDDDEKEEENEDDDEEEEVKDEESEKEVLMNCDTSHGSQKRKRTENVAVQKRSRNDSFNSTSKSIKKAEEVVCIEDVELSDSDSNVAPINESIGHTPMPKKISPKFSKVEDDVSTETKTKKKKKKKKKLNEMLDLSNLSSKSEQEAKCDQTKSTPKKNGKDHPIVVKNGVEIQDVTVGRGPEATSGKIVHVFYVGRLPDKSIFDARLPGKKPFSFKLGSQSVIKGWDIGLEGMRVGGKRRLKIPPNMAYGKSENECIPPNSTLSFMVELQAVN